MLRHSLYKKFAKTSFQPGGEKKSEDVTGNPMGIPTVQAPKTPTPAPNFGVTTPDFLSTFGQGNNIITGAPLGTRETTDENGNAISAAPGYVPPPKETKKEDNVFDKLKEQGKSNWQDYATLGLSGASSILNYQDDIRKQQELQTSIQNRGVDAKPINDYNWMYGRTTSGGTEYQPTIMAKDGAKINTRYGLNDRTISNVEIEGGEFLILPDGTTEIAKGPSHKKGGIDTILPEGTKVFSNHLKPKDLHKMPADQKLMLMNRYMQDGGDVSMGLGLDYLEDMKELIKGSKDKKESDEEVGPKKSGYKDNTRTFAELAKRYDLKQYQELLDNPFTNQVDRQTAELLIRRNQQILDQLFRDQQILNSNSTGEPMPEETQMANGGINNPGFEALPGYVQAKITANMQDGGKKYKLPDNAVILDEKDQTKANVGDYVRSADGTIKKVTKKDMKTIDKGFNTDFGVMRDRFMDPKLEGARDAMYQKYLNDPKHKGTTVSKEQFFNNYLKTQQQLYQIDEAVAKDPKLAASISSEDYDRTAGGMKNKKYQELSKQLGLQPLKEEEISMFQAGYHDLADIQQDPKYAEQLKDFDLTPKGMMDDSYLGKPISGEDAIMGNTTIRQLQRLKNTEQVPELGFENVPEETPPGGEFNVQTVEKGKYEREPFPVNQYIPGAYALAQSQEAFTPAIPEVAAPYVRPQTLNIQSQLQDADNNAIAAMRYGADPNMAYIAGLDSKQKAFQTKQNYDAEGRWKADLYNADAKFKADVYNADAFNTGYNDMYATALGNQSEAKQASIANLVNLKNKYNQDENLKEFYLNTYGPSLNKKQGENKVTPTPGAASFSWSSSSSSSGKTSPAASSTTGTPSVTTGATGTTNPATTSPNTTTPAANSPAKTAVKGNGYQLPANAPEMTANETEPTFNLQAQKTNLNPNLPLSMQYRPTFNQDNGVNLLTLPESMGGAMKTEGTVPPPSTPSTTVTKRSLNTNLPLSMQYGPSFKMGGELDNYLNPFKKNKARGFRKK